jgi:putative RNA 2'-phosphotransferase
MRNQKALDKFSVYLSGVLRHFPEKIGINLNIQGWVEITTLLEKMSMDGHPLTRDELLQIVSTDGKSRYSLSGEGMHQMIRCNQGHSTSQVNLDFTAAEPPAKLYHGTATKNVSEINKMGIIPMSRHYVHLSDNLATASQVGSRHGELHIYEIDAQRMSENGHVFYLSDNNVWLVDCVPYEYLLK